jgi:hypothetical protein
MIIKTVYIRNFDFTFPEKLDIDGYNFINASPNFWPVVDPEKEFMDKYRMLYYLHILLLILIPLFVLSYAMGVVPEMINYKKMLDRKKVVYDDLLNAIVRSKSYEEYSIYYDRIKYQR